MLTPRLRLVYQLQAAAPDYWPQPCGAYQASSYQELRCTFEHYPDYGRISPYSQERHHQAIPRAAGLVGVQHRYAILQDRTREALKLLHPGVEVPSTEQLSTVFLGSAFNRSIKIVTVTLGGKVVTLVTDCWADINGKDVVNYCAVCGIYTFFLESAYTGTQSHDAAFLTADVERVIAKYDFLDVGAVVTDNTSSNQATWKALQEKFYKPFFHGCVCHGLHLLVKDIVKKIKWMDDLQSGCKILVSFFQEAS
ncbi:hypothetical protein PI124_g11160 [Phytophthora idaei]|nr:hypothetical protein PI125_g11294 [Phytophthora idaei]KAG3137808.1 hypothetical protein PI126_g17207 [Phytophthora idaei]KAG3244056.1 hypothetical protein PI124_g11160 [Phytophthora idaei]